MRVLGIDPGLTRCGIGVIEVLPGRKLQLVHVDVLRTPAEAELADRLATIHNNLELILADFQPTAVAVERVFSQANVRSVMGTAQVAGIAMLLARLGDIEVATYTPTEVKSAVSGHGRADKQQVTTMVQRILQLAEPPKPADAADALAIAICHGWRGASQKQLSDAAQSRVRR